MNAIMWTAIAWSLWQTVYMVVIAAVLATLIGLPLGVLLQVTRRGQILSHGFFQRLLAIIINALRSIPFIILMVAVIPLTRFIVGTSIGTSAAIVPLVLAAFPFVARVVDNALDEVPVGLIEAAKTMGAKPFHIIRYIMLPEGMPGMISGLTLMLITLVGYSAMAGAVGGGGLGDLAIRYGYERFDIHVMLVTVIILILLVQLIQWGGTRLSRYLRK